MPARIIGLVGLFHCQIIDRRSGGALLTTHWIPWPGPHNLIDCSIYISDAFKSLTQIKSSSRFYWATTFAPHNCYTGPLVRTSSSSCLQVRRPATLWDQQKNLVMLSSPQQIQQTIALTRLSLTLMPSKLVWSSKWQACSFNDLNI